eukprot:scaffold16330_cov172-Amphora_coffeaeformis.AAC.8
MNCFQSRMISRSRHGCLLSSLVAPSLNLVLVLLIIIIMLQQTQANLVVLDTATESNVLHCRVTMGATMYQDENAGRTTTYSMEQISCVPLRNDGSEDILYDLEQIPFDIRETRFDDIRMGQLYMSITEATLDTQNNVIDTQPTSVFTVLDEPPQEHRRHLKAYTDALGTRRYAIVRVSTSDASPFFTAQQLRSRFTDPLAGMQAQYAACSMNQLQWQLDNVYEVRVASSVQNYVNKAANLRNEAADQLKTQLGLNSISDLADNIMFCIPPGTGGWIANAGTGHWQSQFNDKWCLSLTSVMHELGHNLVTSLSPPLDGFQDWVTRMKMVKLTVIGQDCECQL